MKHTVLCFVVMVLLLACNRKTDVAKYVKHQIGRTIVIDKSHYEFDDNKLLDSLFENSLLMIVTTPREGACASCFFSTLEEVFSLIDSCNTNKVNCVVFTPENYNELLELKTEMGTDHIFFINDFGDSYTKDNELSKYTAEYRTFLIDRERKIRLVGSPLFNKRVKQLYEREIKEALKLE